MNGTGHLQKGDQLPSEGTGRLSGNCCLLHSSVLCQVRMSLAGIFETILKDRAAERYGDE